MPLETNTPEEHKDLSWDFVEEFYPDYATCDKIAYAKDLRRVVNEENIWDTPAEKILIETMVNTASSREAAVRLLRSDYAAVHLEIYMEAAAAFMDARKTLLSQC